MNTIPCGACRKYDPLKGPKKSPNTGMGRCVELSVYGPAHQQPPGAQVADSSAKARMEIVRENEVRSHCIYAEAK